MRRKTAGALTRGGITSGIQKGTLISKTIAYIFRQLPAWRDDADRSDEHSENQLNLQLVKYLDANARREFPMVRFDHQQIQAGRRSVDLSASPVKTIIMDATLHTIYEPILVIEGKRLPAPTRDREKEYVSGGKDNISGGIQRFKLGLHGGAHKAVAMIGYVQEHSLWEWHKQINDWINKYAQGVYKDSCHWHASEILVSLERDKRAGVARTSSVHNRVGEVISKRITLHHLWIEMNFNKNKNSKAPNDCVLAGEVRIPKKRSTTTVKN